MLNKHKLSKILSVMLIILLICGNTFSAIVSNNDGSAFITKSEFEELKREFNEQIDRYNDSISNKIDGAIAAYLSGLKTSQKVSIDALIKVGGDSTNVVVSASPSVLKKNKQMKYAVSYQTTKIDFSGSKPSVFPLIPIKKWTESGGTRTAQSTAYTYTMGVAVVDADAENIVFKTREKDPYVVNGLYMKHKFVYTGAQTFALGWIAVHSIYAWNDLASGQTLKIGEQYDSLSIYDAGASNLTDTSSQSQGYYYRDDDTWQTGSSINYSTNKDKCAAVGNPPDNANNMVFSQNVKTNRHDITDCGGNLIITEDTGIAESTYYILNDDDFEINAWNEKDEYLEQYEEPKKYLSTEHGKKYWFASGSGNAVMAGADANLINCISICRMPFLRPKASKTTNRIENLKELYDGRLSDLTGKKQHYSGGLPLCVAQYTGNLSTKMAIKATTANYKGTISVEIADSPFPSGFVYDGEFQKHLIKLNDQKSWAPIEITPGEETKISWQCKKDKLYYMRFYESDKAFGGQITKLVSFINEST